MAVLLSRSPFFFPPRPLCPTPSPSASCSAAPASSSPRPSLRSKSPPLSPPDGRRFRTSQRMGGAASLPRASSFSSSPTWSPSSPSGSAAEVLRDVSIFSVMTGEPVPFRDLWDQNEGMAVVALLRHFGCICCWELASVLRDSKSKFDSAGVKLIAIGVGTPNNARILAERLPFPLDCLYADPDRKAYDVLGLYYGLGRTFFNPASAKVFSRFKSLQKAAKNYTISATPDDKSSVLQQGGMFVFKGKQLLYARKDEGTGDHAPLDEIFDICCKAPVA